MRFDPCSLPCFLGVSNIRGLGLNHTPTFSWNRWENRKTKGSTNLSSQILKRIWKHLSCRCWTAKSGGSLPSSFTLSFWAWKITDIWRHQPQVLQSWLQTQNSLYSMSRVSSCQSKEVQTWKCSAILGYLHLRFAWFTLNSRSSWVCHVPTATDRVWKPHEQALSPMQSLPRAKTSNFKFSTKKSDEISSTQSPNSSRLGGPRFNTTRGQSSTAIL